MQVLFALDLSVKIFIKYLRCSVSMWFGLFFNPCIKIRSVQWDASNYNIGTFEFCVLVLLHCHYYFHIGKPP